MKKKMYESPCMDVVFIHDTMPLLAGSVMTPGADNEVPGAPVFEEEWVEKAYEFGGWDI